MPDSECPMPNGACLSVVLREDEWQRRAERHRARLAPVVGTHLDRKNRGIKHPAYDFLFDYYAFSPGKLMRWSPEPGVALAGESAAALLVDDAFESTPKGVTLALSRFPPHRLAALRWIVNLLERTTDRTPRFGCFAMHEWAMVYRTGDIRHGQLPLRMAPDDLARFVESQQPLCCTHYDAFRFFTPAARPLNAFQPAKLTQVDFEQPGCLHANMDLYKWAIKFHPWLGADLVADTFLLAVEARLIDMRASPYDCRSLDLEAIPVETEAGRRMFADAQETVARKAVPIRARLLAAFRALDEIVSGIKGVE